MKDSGRHELACSKCGAPLHDLKMMPRKRTNARQVAYAPPLRAQERKKAQADKPIRKMPKKRKSRWSDLFEDAFDIIEDIFD